MNIKFQQYYVTNGSVKAKVHYSVDNRGDKRKCITIYADSYIRKPFHEIFGELAKNDSDSMTDYFETSRVCIFEDHPFYAVARERAEYFIQKLYEKRNKKRAA